MSEKKIYICSKHGGEGNPSCRECWDVLADLFADKNCNVAGLGIPKKKDELK